MEETAAGLGDNVRVRSTPLTQQLGFAGLSGSIWGETMPSLSGVEVIGNLGQDFALDVVFDHNSPHGGLWFAPELVEFVDHAPGTGFMDDYAAIEPDCKHWLAKTAPSVGRPGCIDCAVLNSFSFAVAYTTCSPFT